MDRQSLHVRIHRDVAPFAAYLSADDELQRHMDGPTLALGLGLSAFGNLAVITLRAVLERLGDRLVDRSLDAMIDRAQAAFGRLNRTHAIARSGAPNTISPAENAAVLDAADEALALLLPALASVPDRDRARALATAEKRSRAELAALLNLPEPQAARLASALRKSLEDTVRAVGREPHQRRS